MSEQRSVQDAAGTASSEERAGEEVAPARPVAEPPTKRHPTEQHPTEQHPTEKAPSTKEPTEKEPSTDRLTQFLVALLLLGALLMGFQEVAGDELLEGATQAPGFSLERYGGGRVSLDELRGKVVVLDFWATWCPPCREEMPMLVKVAREFEERGVAFLAIDADDLDEQREAVGAFVARLPELAPYAVYGTPQVGHAYQVKGLPTLYVLDRRGAVVAGETGQVSERQLKRWIDDALDRGAAGPPAGAR